MASPQMGALLRCPAGCEGELEPMGRFAPYRVCPTCGTGYWRPPPAATYWGQRVEPSAEQRAFWGGRGGQWDVAIGPGPGRLLDVGCGFGHVVKWALANGWDPWGCDTDDWARQRSEVPGRVMADIGEFDEPFDLITLWDVLEHVEDPLAFARMLRDHLRPGGRLFVCSPDFAAMRLRWPLLRRDGARFAALIKPEEHWTQFTRTGVRLTLERAGYTDVAFVHPPLASFSNRLLDGAARRWPALRKGFFVNAHVPA